ncbi:Homocysteine S-methyltransferase [Baffinella frigidus]|nr:Homocysteine S-methyltransferase [Cryptophyta sp. CCMP2293]
MLALVEGGCDIIFVETIFDTLNAKAALFAIDVFFEEYGVKMPVVISGTIVDMSGRTLSGQTTEAFWVSVRHANPFCCGLNCALGPDQMRPFMQRMSNVATCYTHAYPNAGLPNAMGGYDLTAKQMAPMLHAWAKDGLVNMAPMLHAWAKDGLVNLIGGCCGTTPEHIKELADVLEGLKPTRVIPNPLNVMRLSGLEDMVITDASVFQNIGERCNVAGSIRFKKMVVANDWSEAAAVATKQVEDGAQLLDIYVYIREDCMRKFCNLIATEPEIVKIPVVVDSSKFHFCNLIATEPEIVKIPVVVDSSKFHGKCIVNSISLKVSPSPPPVTIG